MLMIINGCTDDPRRRLGDIPGICLSLQFPFVPPRGQIQPCTHQIMMKTLLIANIWSNIWSPNRTLHPPPSYDENGAKNLFKISLSKKCQIRFQSVHKNSKFLQNPTFLSKVIIKYWGRVRIRVFFFNITWSNKNDWKYLKKVFLY